jgi:hypothetical protein
VPEVERFVLNHGVRAVIGHSGGQLGRIHGRDPGPFEGALLERYPFPRELQEMLGGDLEAVDTTGAHLLGDRYPVPLESGFHHVGHLLT